MAQGASTSKMGLILIINPEKTAAHCYGTPEREFLPMTRAKADVRGKVSRASYECKAVCSEPDKRSLQILVRMQMALLGGDR